MTGSKGRKIFVIVAVSLVLLVVLVMPLIVGKIFENKFKYSVEKIQAKLKDRVEVTSTFYRGYFYGKTELNFKILTKELSPSIRLESKLNYLALSAKTNVTFDRHFQMAYLGESEKDQKLEVKTSFRITGGLSNSIVADTFSILTAGGGTARAGGRVVFSGLDMSIDVGSSIGRGLDVLFGEEGSFDLERVSLVAQEVVAYKPSDSDPNGKYFQIILPGIQIKLDQKNKIFNGAINVTFDKYLDSEQKEWKEGVLKLKATNIAIDFVEGIKKIIVDLSGSNSGDAAKDDMKVKVLGRLMTTLPSFIKFSPRVDLTKLNLKTSNGDLVGTGFLSIPNSSGGLLSFLSTMSVLLHIDGPEFIAEKLFAKYYLISAQIKESAGGALEEKMDPVSMLSAKAPMLALAKAAPPISEAAAADKLLQQRQQAEKDAQTLLAEAYNGKYFLKKGGDFSFKFEYKNSEMKLNDEPFYFSGKK